MPRNVQQAIDNDAFDCPHCGAYAYQWWFFAALNSYNTAQSFPAKHGKPRILTLGKAGLISRESVSDLDVSRCQRCHEICIWIAGKMAYPNRGRAPLPNTDLPPDIKRDFEEAGAILDRSPRGATALLRLCIQKLCVHLGEKGENLNADIGALVKKGLPLQIQKALDIVRVIGNDAVHPGKLDLGDNIQTATTLFSIVNMIANDMITQPRAIDELYTTLPESKLQAIADRDQNKDSV